MKNCDFKVGTTFRFYPGSEDQAIDPLIGSIEGIASTPAYRGLALAVFEDLELGQFGNRIPFLTFEIEADDPQPTIGMILSDASSDLISIDATESVRGFAAYGRSMRNAVEALVESFGIYLFDDGTALRAPGSSAPQGLDDGDLGNSADRETAPRLQREQLPARACPASLRLTYYDADRDYQTSEARAVADERSGDETQQELPAVLAAGDAKSLAQRVLARAWSSRDKLTLRLSPAWLGLEPGSEIALPLSPTLWTVEQTTVDGFVMVTEMKPSCADQATVAGDGGRIVPNPDVVSGPVSLALFDVPNVLGLSATKPTLLLAASTPSAGWKRSPIEISAGGQFIAAETARRKSQLGTAFTPLGIGATDLFDELNSVDVQLIDPDQWLTSCDDAALANGANLAVLGQEAIQFGRVLPIGAGKFRLSHLLRGRGGTEWAREGHVAGEPFCKIDPACVQTVTMPPWSLGALVAASGSSADASSIQFGGEAVRPLTPVNLVAQLEAGGDLSLQWTRRSRQGFAWIDGVDAPIGEAREEYRVTVTGIQNILSFSVGEPQFSLPAVTVATLGSGPATVAIQQIGDLAASRPAQVNINLS